jgi:phosphoribosyl 1,2-cyclic phosphodiesterase
MGGARALVAMPAGQTAETCSSLLLVVTTAYTSASYYSRMNSSLETSPSVPNRLRLQSLASGSSGNAYLMQSGDDLILIDCGIGIRQVRAALETWGRSVDDVAGLVITHEHSDHVRSLAAFQRTRTGIYCTRGTANALGLQSNGSHPLRFLESIEIGSIRLTPIKTSHDAAEPCGLLIETGNRTIGLLTDLGTVSDDLSEVAARCDLLILESNHDPEMLRTGPYPTHLKRRVSGDHGHQSNDQAGGLIGDVTGGSSSPAEIWLAHLSATNNTPSVAERAVRSRFRQMLAPPALVVLPRGRAGPLWDGATVRPRQMQLLVDV